MKTYNPYKSGRTIYVENNDIERALSRLKHETAQLMKEIKMKRFFESNTEKRRRKMKSAIIKEKQRQRKSDMFF